MSILILQISLFILNFDEGLLILFVHTLICEYSNILEYGLFELFFLIYPKTDTRVTFQSCGTPLKYSQLLICHHNNKYKMYRQWRIIIGTLIVCYLVSAQTSPQVTKPPVQISGLVSPFSSFKTVAAISVSARGGNTANFAMTPQISTVSAIPNVVANRGATVIQSKQTSQNITQNTNSYIPKTPGDSQPSKQTQQANTIGAKSAQSCVKFANTYWTGSRCSCRVGYKLEAQSGLCVPISIIRRQPIVTCNQNESLLYGQCICLSGYQRNSEGTCTINIKPIQCPENSQFKNGDCMCKEGFKQIGTQCISECGNNGLTSQFLCPPFSEWRDNACVCISGYRQIGKGVCSQCPEGSIFIDGSCMHTCGANQQFNPSTIKCECKEGFAVFTDGCTTCPDNFFIRGGYCVACPINTVYNPQKNTCDCPTGFQIVLNACVPICKINQQYDKVVGKCRCIAGTALLANGLCGLCPSNQFLDPVAQKCGPCPSGQVLQGIKCVCDTGFGIGLSGNCVKCDKQNERLMSGYCVVCPSNKVWSENSCKCPVGLIESNGVCTKQCLSTELVDANGLCYSCLINEQVSGTICSCKTGFQRDPTTKLCLPAKCSPGQFLIQGICATCPLGAVYNPTLRQCSCPEGYYRNLNGICEKKVITCSPGFYLNIAGVACVPCPTGCSTCGTAGVCLSCFNLSANIVGGVCVVNLCGNNIVDFGETCDDGNRNSGDGCSSTCQKQFSQICGNGLLNTGEKCDDGNTRDGDGCSALCQIESLFTCTSSQPSICSPIVNSGLQKVSVNFNSITIYVTLRTARSFTFSSEQQMLNFMKVDFPVAFTPNSYICRQKSTQRQIFDCMLIYGAGKVPSEFFRINFSYNKDGFKGNLTVDILRPTQSKQLKEQKDPIRLINNQPSGTSKSPKRRNG